LKKKFFITADGSPSIKIEELNETYHSVNGAIRESAHIYIDNGLNYWIKKNNKKKVEIFDMGMGTGLNIYLSFVYCKKRKIQLEINSIEKFPLNDKEVKLLSMKKSLPEPNFHFIFEWIHKCMWNKKNFKNGFIFYKLREDFLNFKSKKKYDIIFYDAFGYHAQFEMWQEKTILNCFKILKPGGLWISYCSKGLVKRNLERVGFQVEKLEGPKGKREILRALKI